MHPDGHGQTRDSSDAGHFVTTHWSVVLAAGQDAALASRKALERLCLTYWTPLYFFARGQGFSVEDAEDLIQGFFMGVLEKDTLKKVEKDRGRFRSFLLSALRFHMANESRKARAAKRGSGQRVFSLDFETAENHYSHYLAENHTPEKLFERQWAKTVMAHALERLGRTYARTGKQSLFQSLRNVLVEVDSGFSYGETAAALNIKEGALRVALHRMRRRLADSVREEIAQTVAHADDIEDEIRNLFSAFE